MVKRVFWGVAAVVAAAVILAAVMIWKRVQGDLQYIAAPNWGGEPVSRRYRKEAAHEYGHYLSMGEAHPRVKSDILIRLDFLTPQEIVQWIRFQGVTINSIEKHTMEFGTDPQMRGYDIAVNAVSKGSKPRVFVADREVKLAQDRDMPDLWENIPEVNERKSALNRVPVVTARSPEAHGALIVGDRKSAYVLVDPAPAFEVDYFTSGNWDASYCVWWTSEDRKRAVYRVFPHREFVDTSSSQSANEKIKSKAI